MKIDPGSCQDQLAVYDGDAKGLILRIFTSDNNVIPWIMSSGEKISIHLSSCIRYSEIKASGFKLKWQYNG